MGSDQRQFNISLIVRDKVSGQCPQTTTFEEKGELKRIRTEVPLLTSLTLYRWAKPAHTAGPTQHLLFLTIEVSVLSSKPRLFFHLTIRNPNLAFPHLSFNLCHNWLRHCRSILPLVYVTIGYIIAGASFLQSLSQLVTSQQGHFLAPRICLPKSALKSHSGSLAIRKIGELFK